MKKFTLFFLSFVLCFGVAAQKNEKLPENDEKMLSFLTKLFEESKKDSGKLLIEKKLAPMWLEENAFTSNQKLKFRETINLFITSKCKIFPDYNNYIEAFTLCPNSQKTESELLDWNNIVIKIYSDKKLKKIGSEFVESTVGLFKDFTFYKTDWMSWKSDNSNYKFIFDSLPRIEFASLNLKCFSRGDSTIIYETSGNYFPSLERFFGNRGKVTWERAGYDRDKTYATIGKYDIRIKESNYAIDSVLFYNEFFDQPLKGKLTEKIISNKNEDNTDYPMFESYFKRLEIKNIVPNVDYEGGFKMAGKKLEGTGTLEEPARITFYREKKPLLIAQSRRFEIRPDRIKGANTSIKIRLDSDSICHPDLFFLFIKKTRDLELSRTEEGISPSPFENTYHEVEMYFETLKWNIDAPYMSFGSFGTTPGGFADFESIDYFKQKRFSTLAGIASEHPIYILKRTGDAMQSNSFNAIAFAQQAHTGVEQWIPTLIDLTNKGYIHYDLETRDIVLLDKLFKHIQNVKGKADYDAIQFISEVDRAENARLSLLDRDILIKGVNSVLLSDSQKVFLYPNDGEILLHKDRDFSFSGRLNSGNFELLGAKYNFIYDQFKFEMAEVDSCVIYVDDLEGTPDNFGNYPKIRLKNVLAGLSGTLQIDHPTNKSGYHSKDYPTYPILNCDKSSSVYWDKHTIQKGAYKKDGFYYEVDPFTLDSLDNFKNKNLKFTGSLVSGGIFPDIKEPLVLMDDFSLGFHVKTGESGFPAYDGKATVTGDLTLNNSGLNGKGKLNYLTSESTSDSFTYVPQEVFGTASTFSNESSKKANVPDATSSKIDLSYLPLKNYLNVTTKANPIDCFSKEAIFNGTMQLNPTGMTGNGTADFVGAKLSSKSFKLKNRKILADTSQFQLKSNAEDVTLAFKTDNVNAEVDFDARKGIFKSNSGETKIEFPSNLYICFMDQFTWFMDKSEMELSSNRKATSDLVIDTDAEKKRSNFFSIDPNQDSLNFLSPFAKYDLKNTLLTCRKIDYIIVADSKVQPDSNYVVIEKWANMRKLSRAQIISNFVTQHHKIFNASLKIDGRKRYEGSGDMVYKDENKKEQKIHVTNFHLDSAYQTVAYGEIAENDQFFLSPAFEYYGRFELHASNPNLTFHGGVRILHNCNSVARTYLKFKSEINPLEIYIPVDSTLRDMSMSKLGVGVMIRDELPLKIYPGFLSAKSHKNDRGLIESSGFLYFDKVKKTYFIGSKEKIRQPKLPGQLLGFNTTNCELVGDGVMDFNIDLGMITMRSAGTVHFNTTDSVLNAQSTTLLNFPFDEGAQKYLSEKLINANLDPIDLTKTQFEKSLIQFLGEEKSDKVIADMALDGELKRLPEELQQLFYFGDLKWIWHDDFKTFTTSGPIGIASMGKKQIFKYIKGLIEIEKVRSGDVFRLYLEIDGGTWYFFEYKTNIMNISTSDDAFVEIIRNVKDENKRFEDGKKRFSFAYIQSKKKKDDMLKRYPEINQ
jgi:hypothetical protein